MRMFVSLPIPDSIVQLWSNVQHKLNLNGVRWSSAQHLHITLMFLGDTHPRQLAELETTLDQRVRDQRSFTIQFRGGGAFPEKGRPSSFWLGLDGERDALQDCAKRVQERMSALGFPLEDREYRPHVTVARVQSTAISANQGSVLRAEFCQQLKDFESPSFMVDRLWLMESHLSAQGSRYEQKGCFLFKR